MSGRRIGRFVVERSLGAGGMGAVFAARDEVLDRLVALKVLPAAVESDPDRRQRLLREARSAAALSHPNVAIVYEAGEGEGTVFLAMELVDGEPLSSRLERGPLSLEELARIGAGIARGLACAHDAGVIHRDLKPANVMIAKDGTPKLVDFGLARAPERRGPHEARESYTGMVVGTLGYMAPEQLHGESTDARTDLFALGVVLHELWTGVAPFGHDGLAAMARTLYEEAPPLERLRRDTPLALSELVTQLLQKEPAQRSSSAREVAARLERLVGVAAPAVPTAPTLELTREALAGRVAVAASAIAATEELRLERSEPSLLGRDEELASLEQALASGALLVTITGPPGIGKTALASQLARRLAARGERATWVELDPTATQAELESALVVALRREGPRVRVADLLALEEGTVFVDGAEASASELAAHLPGWLARAPNVRFVLSRRNVLGLDAERVRVLGPLPHEAGCALFRERARRARPGAAAWSRDELEAVDAIVRQLEASPLALSLAASRVSLLSPREIAARLAAGGHEARLALLTDRKASGSVKSLREAIAWSFALLSDADARVLVRLSLFEAPFTTQAAEHVALLPGESADPLHVLDALEAARAASLVRTVDDARGEIRTLLEGNVRAYARTKLAEDPRAHEVEEAFVHELGANARDAVIAPEHAGRLVALEAASFRAAARLATARVARGDAGLAIPALWCASLLLAHVPDTDLERALEAMLAARAGALPGELHVHAELALFHRQLERDVEGAIARAARIVEEAQFLGDPGLLAQTRGLFFDALVRGGRLEPAREVAERMLEAARAVGVAAHEIDAHEKLAVIAWRGSRPEDALGALGRALALAESLRDRRRQAHVLLSLGIQCVQMRRFLEARAFYERSRELARAEHLSRVVATLANNLGVVHHEENRLDEARASFEEAAEHGARAGMALLVGVARGNAGMVDHEAGRRAEARVALDAAVGLLTSLGDTRYRAVFFGARAALHADEGALEAAQADLAAAGALLEHAFEPQLALALSIRSAHVELAQAARRGDAASRARARAAAEAHLVESSVASSVAARSDLARMAMRALARRVAREGQLA